VPATFNIPALWKYKSKQKYHFKKVSKNIFFQAGTETGVAGVPVAAEFPPLFIINFNKGNGWIAN
jgi:hypothetical protein